MIPRNRFGFEKDEVLLVTVGRLVPRKATLQVISLMESLKDQKVRLIIVGNGPEEEFLKEEMRKRNLDEQIVFMGYVTEAEKFGILQMSDVYVSTWYV